MAIQEQFEEFYEKIKLTSLQREDAKTKYRGVCKALHNYYYPTLDYTGDTKLLIGSYGKHTHIRPPRDIDVIFKMPPEKFQQYDDNTSNKQSQLLQDIREILIERYPTTNKISAWGKVVLVEFADNAHSVELVPAWEQVDGSFMIPNSENGGSWEYWNPKEEIEKIKKSNIANNQKTIPLIRMIKKWTENCTVGLKSFQIEEKVVSFISSENCKLDYAKLVRDFFQYLADVTYSENVKSHIQTALNRATKACEFEANSKLRESADEWKKVFGDNFPAAEMETRTETIVATTFHQIVAKLRELFPATTEEHLDRKYGITTVLNPMYSVQVDVSINQNGWRQNHWLLSEFQKRGYRIQKSASLLFKIISHNVPEPYSVKWKVRNFGNEAHVLGALRGEITDDDGSETKKERTLYLGEHYVECYIIKGNQCVAVGHIFIPIG